MCFITKKHNTQVKGSKLFKIVIYTDRKCTRLVFASNIKNAIADYCEALPNNSTITVYALYYIGFEKIMQIF